MIMNQIETLRKEFAPKGEIPVESINSVFISELIYVYESKRVPSKKEFAPKGEIPRRVDSFCFH